MNKMRISGEFANEKINKALEELETQWKRAGVIDDQFKAEKRLFKQLLFNELGTEYDICDHGC